MKKVNYTEVELISGLRERKSDAFDYLHTKTFNIIRLLVKANSGSDEDVEDLYNEGIVALLEFVDKPGLEMTSKLTTLFVAICKNQWFIVLEKRKSAVKHKNKIYLESSYEESFEEELDESIYNDILWQSFKKLNKDCQTIIRGYLKGIPVKDLAELMGFSPGYLKKKKHYCYKHLIKYITENQVYREMKMKEEIRFPL